MQNNVAEESLHMLNNVAEESLHLQHNVAEESLYLQNNVVGGPLCLQNEPTKESLHLQINVAKESVHLQDKEKEPATLRKPQTLTNDSLSILLTYLDVVDLLPLLHVCKTWREMALYKLNSVSRLYCSEIKRKLNSKKLQLGQKGIEKLLGFCKERLISLDLRVCSNYKVYYDLERLLQVVGCCDNLEELLLNYPQRSKVSRHQISLPKTLRLLHVGGNMPEELLAVIIGQIPKLTSVTLENNLFVTGDSITQSLPLGGLKKLSLHRCSDFTPENLHTILKNSSKTLETVSITGFPDAEVLDFDKSDIECFDAMRDLVVSSWYARNSLKFSFVFPLLELTPNLTKLSLQHCFNLDKDPTMLRSLPQMCPLLKTLDLTGCVLVSAANLTPLAKLTNLAKLVLRGIKIVGEGEMFDVDMFVSDIILKLRSLEILLLEDPTRSSVQDSHIYNMVSSNQVRLRKLSVSFAGAINGDFIEQCRKLKRPGEIDVIFTMQKGNSRGELLSGKMSCAPPFLHVFVSWED